ncbi:MAG: ABC transporter permease subunit [Planctomycetes bacterium]|nr:ABC transporter permease subunit [Planctomycetota bacterium]
MTGVLLKSLREVWVGTVLTGAGLFVFQALLNFILPQVVDEVSQIWLQMPFVRTLLSALLGTDFGDGITAQMTQAIVWVHPVVLALLWAHVIVHATRFPAGEVDRGTVDVLLGLPLSRRRIYVAETVMGLVTGIVIVLVGLAGYLLGSRATAPENRSAFGAILLVAANLYGVYVAVGGMSFLVSACSDRRGRAIATNFGIVLASFLLTFLAGFWDPAQNLAFLSVLDYYQPAEILRSGTWPWKDFAVLFGFGLITWLVGDVITARRSLCTV